MMKEAGEDPLSTLPWNSQFYSVPAEVKKIPTMLTDEEGRMLRWLTEFEFTGAGAICELGSFVGGSTARLAFGLSRNRRSKGVIHAFDRFECAESMKADLLYSKGIPRFEGIDILPVARKLLSAFASLISFHKGDVNAMQWEHGPIEILFIDIAKTADTADHIARHYFPHLIPGRSIVVHQDYFHHHNPWCAIQMEMLAGKFDLVGYAQDNSALFRLKEKLSEEDLQSCSWHLASPEKRVNLAVQAMRRFPHVRQREHLARLAKTIADQPNAAKASEFAKRKLAHTDIQPWLSRVHSS